MRPTKAEELPYRPPADVWSDDGRMNGLMSMFKLRAVNPHDYDAKMKFWTHTIQDSCAQLRNPVVSYKELTNRFKRKDRVPAGLKNVLEEMYRNGQTQTLDEFRRGTQSWLGWGMESLITKPASWLLGYSSAADVTTDHLVVLEAVKAQADEVLQRYRDSEASLEDDGGVVEVCVLRGLTGDICATDTALELALVELERNGHVCLGLAPNGDKIVKFRDSKDTEVRVTEVDTNTHNVKKAVEKLDKDIQKLEATVRKLEQDARTQVRLGNKVKAKQILRQKQLVTKQLDDKDKQYSKLSTLVHSLSQTNDHRHVMDAYKAGVSAFKQNLDRHGLSPDRVDDTMEDIREAMSDHDEISVAIAQGPSGDASSVGDEDLERELAELLSGDTPVPRPHGDTAVPNVDNIHLPDLPSPSAVDEEEEAPRKKTARRNEPTPKANDRLQQLRRQLEAA